MCIRTSDDVRYDVEQATVERDEVEEELDDGAGYLCRIVGGCEGLLDDLGERDQDVARRDAGRRGPSGRQRRRRRSW